VVSDAFNRAARQHNISAGLESGSKCKLAKILGLTFPLSLLALADEVIE
jgi:hypothetical protein